MEWVVNVFDTVLGLPVHALVIHGVVVLLPLMALVTIAVAFVPAWRSRLSWLVVVVDAGLVGMTYVARASGEAFQERLQSVSGDPVAVDHEAIGKNLVWFALALFVASVVVALTRRSARAVPSGLLAVVAGGLAVWWTIRTGHSGTEAVWQGVVENTNAK